MTAFSHIVLGKGRVTLAIRITGNTLGNPGFIEVGMAFCAPGDQFSRAKGRKMAEGRLNAKRGKYYFTVARDPGVKLKRQAQEMVLLLPQNRLPHWTREDAGMSASEIRVRKLLRKASAYLRIFADDAGCEEDMGMASDLIAECNKALAQ